MLMQARSGLTMWRPGQFRLPCLLGLAMLCSSPAAGQSIRIGLAQTPFFRHDAETLIEERTGRVGAALGTQPTWVGRFLWGTGTMPPIQLGTVTNDDLANSQPHLPGKVDLVFDLEQGQPGRVKVRTYAWQTKAKAYDQLVSDEWGIDQFGRGFRNEALRERLTQRKSNLRRPAS